MNISKLLKYSYDNKLSHIASSLSMLTYIDVLFSNKIVIPKYDYIIIGKPFGAQAYYLIWKELGYLDNIETLSVGVKHDEIDFVNYGEETMGNALGVAIGIALTNHDINKCIYVNISDATLQMGNTLEALQFIGHHNIKNIFVTVDYNNSQVTGSVDDILKTDPIINMCKEYGWNVQEVDGHNKIELDYTFRKLDKTKPNIVFCKTKKGHGVPSIERDHVKWHYKKIETLSELQSLEQELLVT